MSDTSSQKGEEVAIELAEGFNITYQDEFTKIETHSLVGNEDFQDSIFILHRQMTPSFTKNRKIVPKNWTSICCQSSTHLAYLQQLNQTDLVTGLCGLSYVTKGPIKDQLEKNKTAEICIGEAAQLESLLAQNPEIYFTYPFSSEQNRELDKKGVQTFMIAEYLEKTPLARLEWIKLFAVLFQQEKQASTYFDQVKKEYLQLAQEDPDTNKKFIFNLPFGDTWYAPSSNSLIVQLLEDAGLYYYFHDEVGTENMAHPNEKIWEIGGQVSYWVIVASRPEGFNLADLVAENEVYGTFKSVIHHQVIFCNTATTDYFIKGVIEPHIMLKDLLFATHKIREHNPVYFRLLK
ncbi:MAG: ABC transporter substrate-binding protein [Crocinitomicaceae bacterium]